MVHSSYPPIIFLLSILATAGSRGRGGTDIDIDAIHPDIIERPLTGDLFGLVQLVGLFVSSAL